MFLVCIFILANTANSKAQQVTIINNTVSIMHVSYSVIVPGTCADAQGRMGADANVVTLGQTGSQSFPIDPTEVIDQVIATPEPFCSILGDDTGPCGVQGYSAYYTSSFSCAPTSLNICGCQHWVSQSCPGNPNSWCISVVGNTITIS